MQLPHLGVEPYSSEEEPLSVAPVIVDVLIVIVFVQIASIRSHFFLRVDIFEHLGALPPLITGLNHDSVRPDLLDELLCPLRKHC